MSAVVPQQLVGKVLDGRYRLVEVIGRGGYSTVFRALHERMPKQFAVKVLHRHHAQDPEQVRRFAEEVRAIAVLDHPNIVEVVDYAEDPVAGWYIVMPLLMGEPLSARQQRLHTLPAVDLHHVVVQAAGALDAAHRAGVVHRDVKPENLFLQTDPAADCGFSLRVLDFGIAKFRTQGTGRPDDTGKHRAVARSPSGVVGLGTPDFMSPEQVLGEPVDARTDVYALGLVLYECLTGELPYDAADRETLLKKRSTEDAAPPSRTVRGSWIPRGLDDLVLAMVARDRTQRPATMADVTERWQEVQPAFDEAWALHHLVPRPFKVRAAPVLAEPARAPDGGEAAPQVLVVDDQDGIRSLMRRVLQRAGLTCATAASVSEALQRIAGQPQPQAVVIDVLMPDVDGLEALGYLRDAGFAGRVIVCSSLESPPVRASALQRGADVYLVKGRDLTRLPDVLRGLGVVPEGAGDHAPRS